MIKSHNNLPGQGFCLHPWEGCAIHSNARNFCFKDWRELDPFLKPLPPTPVWLIILEKVKWVLANIGLSSKLWWQRENSPQPTHPPTTLIHATPHILSPRELTKIESTIKSQMPLLVIILRASSGLYHLDSAKSSPSIYTLLFI